MVAIGARSGARASAAVIVEAAVLATLTVVVARCAEPGGVVLAGGEVGGDADRGQRDAHE